jgi:formate hydrogenlyase transcriptional activator
VRLMVHVSPSTVPALQLPTLLHSVSASLRGVARCRGVTVLLRGEENGASASAPAQLAPSGFPDQNRVIPISEGLPVRGVPVRKADVVTEREGSQFFPETGSPNHDEEKAICCVPLLVHDRPVGILALKRSDENSFVHEDIEFLSRLAREVARDLVKALGSDGDGNSLREPVQVEDETEVGISVEGIIGRSHALTRVLAQVKTVAPTDSTVLLFGETGTGKEVIARAIHELSSRRLHNFVKCNCAAIPSGLLESEFFGHEKGAFTGAISRRIGRFELADQGTIFLDEVGEIPLELQPKLLRVLQEREFERVGSSQTLRSGGRLIAATNRDLASLVDEHRFRADLFYRLNVFPIQVPALRERPEDIPLLARHFVQHFARRMNKKIEIISSEMMQALVGYSWPGNIRELQNLIERAVILSSGSELKIPVRDLRRRVTCPLEGTKHMTLEEVERAHILATLKDTKWVLFGPKGAAERLGIKRTTLQYRMQKLGIVRPGK